MIVVRNDRQPDAEPGPESQFEGMVQMRRAIDGDAAAGVRVYLVSFRDGARTHWHDHTGVQVLYVVDGQGRVQKWGEPPRDIGPGDMVHVAPGEKHWHGAAPDGSMSHVAVTAGKTNWMEAVND